LEKEGGKSQLIRLVILFLVFVPLISGCGGGYAVLKAPIHRPPLVEPLPLTVGVYFSPKFKSGVPATGLRPGIREVQVGPAQTAVFKHVFSGLFESVVALDQLPIGSQFPAEVDAIIVPSLEANNFIALEYSFEMTSSDGSTIAQWSVTGVSEEWPGRTGNEAIQLAMRSAAAKFTVGFRKHPDIQNWLRRMGIADDVSKGSGP
jgi:hypothetical protein